MNMYSPYILTCSPEQLARWAGISQRSLVPMAGGKIDNCGSAYSIASLSPLTGKRILSYASPLLVTVNSLSTKGSCTASQYIDLLRLENDDTRNKRRRPCLIPATSFHEEQLRGNVKQVCSFSLVSGQIFAMAGYLEAAPATDRSTLYRFAVIRVQPNWMLSSSFEGTPAIIPPHEFNRWLECGGDYSEADEMLLPIPSVALKSWMMRPLEGPLSERLRLSRI